MRKPAVAGSFYEDDRRKLKLQIETCFDQGPGSMPSGPVRPIKAVIAPHAGYQYSGNCAAWAFKEIGEAGEFDVYIILGPNHSGAQSAIATQDFETPLGVVQTDVELAKTIAEISRVPINNPAHEPEHSIEVQLPFLQTVSPQAKIVAILAANDFNFKQLGLDIKEALVKVGRSALIIASSDFTHYGHNYGFVPFETEVKDRMYALDKGAIGAIKELSAEKFLDYCFNTGATVCGQQPIAVMLHAASLETAKLLFYYTSGDVTNDYKNAVGYASIVLK